ncbi:MAG: 3-oxoacyl-ACP synthase [Gammaproteobacteria bacterium]|nr:3-oxoacyl-ACP synthase [Gammaproteobacteria bacterium]
MKERNAYIIGTGSYLPGEPIPFSKAQSVLGELNDIKPKVKRWFDNNSELMREMLGINYYHYVIDPLTGEITDDMITMAVKASKNALELSSTKVDEIDFICYASPILEQMPTASVRIQAELGIDSCAEMSIHANCTSSYKALMVAAEFIESGRYNTALVVSSNIMSGAMTSEFYNQKVATREDILLRWFLCDGAGALILSSKKPAGRYLKVNSTYIESIGGNKDSMMFNRRPAYPYPLHKIYDQGMHHTAQSFRQALNSEAFIDPVTKKSLMFCGIERMLKKFPTDVSKLEFLQINLPSKQVVLTLAGELKDLKIDADKLYTNMAEVGYSGPPAVFICVDSIFRNEDADDGRLVISFVTEVSKFMQAGFVLECGNFVKNNIKINMELEDEVAC